MNSSINRPDILASIDVGTTKIVTIIAKVTSPRAFEIIGVGRCPSRGMRKGLIVNLDDTIAAIREAKATAERMAGEKIGEAFVGVTGQYIQNIPTSGIVAVTDPHKKITSEDKSRAIEVAKSKPIAQDQKYFDIVMKEFIVDGQTGIKDPIGMDGLRLELNAILLTGSTQYFDTLTRAIQAADIEVANFFLEAIASGEAVLTGEEKDQGVLLVDIGGGTTDIAFYKNGNVQYTAILPIGGDHLDSDLAYGLAIPMQEANRIKTLKGGVDQESLNSVEMISITRPNYGDTVDVPVKIMSEIILPRMDELFNLVKTIVVKKGHFRNITSGIVLTGGGAKLKGITSLAEDVFGLSVRIGRPYNVMGLREDVQSPIFSTAVGLIRLAQQRMVIETRVPPKTSGGKFKYLNITFEELKKRFLAWYYR